MQHWQKIRCQPDFFPSGPSRARRLLICRTCTLILAQRSVHCQSSFRSDRNRSIGLPYLSIGQDQRSPPAGKRPVVCRHRTRCNRDPGLWAVVDHHIFAECIACPRSRLQHSTGLSHHLSRAPDVNRTAHSMAAGAMPEMEHFRKNRPSGIAPRQSFFPFH